LSTTGKLYIFVVKRAAQAGVFPKPVKIGSLSMWVVSEIEAWVDNRIAERDAA
jgi:predicted DNA-binding transcriptional regulator AlpA